MTPPAPEAPSVTVVIAARNEARLIGECLESLSEQVTPPNFETIVVDNGSTDGTAEVASRYSCRIVAEPRVGQLQAKHRGVLEARGDVVALLDADCVAHPGWVAAIADAFTGTHGARTAAVTRVYRFPRGMPWWARAYVDGVEFVLVNIYRRLLPSMPFVVGGNVAFRRTLYLAGGGFDFDAGIAETELGLARRLARFGRVRYNERMLVTTSSRRFEFGFAHFATYKSVDYFYTYLCARFRAARATT